MKKYFFLALLFFQPIFSTTISLKSLIQTQSIANPAQALKSYIEQSNTPVIVKFFANWCGPCQRMQKTLESIDAQFKEKITIVSINVDEFKALSQQYGIAKIPTLIYFKNGKQVNQTNFTTKETIIKIIKTLL